MSNRSPELEALVAASRRATEADPAHRERLKANVLLAASQPGIDPPSPAAPPAPSLAPWAAANSALGAWLGVGVLTAALGGAAVFLFARTPAHTPARTTSASTSQPSSSATRREEPERLPESTQETDVGTFGALDAALEVGDGRSRPKGTSDVRERGSAPASSPAPSIPPPATARAGSSELERELRSLAKAQAAFKQGEFAAARKQLNTHLSEFPRGQLAPEARALSLMLDCQQNGVAGKQRTKEALAHEAKSVWAAKIRAVCGLE